MSQNNSNNDSQQENHRQPNFIFPVIPVVNSDNETGRKERGKAWDSPKEPAEKVVAKAKVAKSSPKRKVLKQNRKSRKRRQSTSSSSDSEEIERKRKKKCSGWKRKRKSLSSCSFVPSSGSTADSDSEVSATDKKFKVILKGEEFKRNLPSSMAEYANNHFNYYFSDKDIEEQLLTEDPVPSNLQQVKSLDDFIRLLLFSETVMISDHQTKRFHGKTYPVYGKG